jgi:small subunit ribosomal protein S24e
MRNFIYEVKTQLYDLSVDVLTLNDHDNSLLNRREISVIFSNAAGKIKRIEAAQLVANKKNVDPKNVIPISMKGQKGKTDLHGIFYIYNSPEQAKSQLPRYRILRTLPKDERKKIIDEAKAARLKAKQALAKGSKTASGKGKK